VINNHIAAFSNGYWFVDTNDNHAWDSADTVWGQFGAGSVPLVINNHIAAFSNGYWFVDTNDNHAWDSADTIWGQFGAGSTPLIIDNHIAAFSNGYWFVDTNDNHAFDGADTIWGQFGAGSTPLIIAGSVSGSTSIQSVNETPQLTFPFQPPVVSRPVAAVPKVEMPVQSNQAIRPMTSGVVPSTRNPLAGAQVPGVRGFLTSLP